MYKYIIFDMDGTLIDSLDAHIIAFKEAFLIKGYKIKISEIRKKIGKTSYEIIKELIPSLSDKEIFSLQKLHRMLFKNKYYKLVKLKSNALEILNYLKGKNYNLALFSSNTKETLTHNLKKLNISNFFNEVVSLDDIKNPKPSPEGLLKITKGCKDAIYIGDTKYDVLAAKRAKIKSVILLGTLTKEKILPYHPDFIIKDLIKVKNIIK